jgi:peptidyl-prolyl cis-trans isomerase B (cyclophilin B)
MWKRFKKLFEGTKKYDFSHEALAACKLARIRTAKGDIIVQLLPEVAPNTVSNFVHLINAKFYHNLKFHRHIAGFVAQGGCPVGDGSGGPGWKIASEFHDDMPSHKRGTLSMAHAGRNTAGSQFFFVLEDQPDLDSDFSVFATIEEGDRESFEVMDSLRQDDIIESIEIVQKEA